MDQTSPKPNKDDSLYFDSFGRVWSTIIQLHLTFRGSGQKRTLRPNLFILWCRYLCILIYIYIYILYEYYLLLLLPENEIKHLADETKCHDDVQ